MIRHFLAILLALPVFMHGTDLMPWLSRDYEIQLRPTFQYASYRKIESPHRDIHHSGNPRFYTVSGGISRYDLSGEVEATLANSHPRQNPACDNFRVTARYRLLNDVGGNDPISLVTGLTLTQAFKHSVRDPSSFHHGKGEAELHLSIGREKPCEQFWLSRWWGVLGFGCADQGSPWVRLDFDWERNWWDVHQVRLYAHTLWGLGHHDFNSIKTFHGYGPIGHQSVDLGIRYSYLLCSGMLSIEYAYRVYSQNFPSHVNLFTISFLYPIGL